jgi:hypothetical protein
MEAIEAVVALTKERDEISEELDTYESWFEGLVGRTVTYGVVSKKHTRFVECRITEFNPGEGWELTGTTGDDPDLYQATFEDFVTGRMHVHGKRVHFA